MGERIYCKRGHKEIFLGDGTVPYLDCGGGYTMVYNLENSPNCTFKMGGLYCMQVTPEKSWSKKTLPFKHIVYMSLGLAFILLPLMFFIRASTTTASTCCLKNDFKNQVTTPSFPQVRGKVGGKADRRQVIENRWKILYFSC